MSDDDLPTIMTELSATIVGICLAVTCLYLFPREAMALGLFLSLWKIVFR